MKIHRFFIKNDINLGELEVSDSDFLNQVQKVLRLQKKEKIIIFNHQETDFLSEIIDFHQDKVLLNVLESQPNPSLKSVLGITLFCSVLKKDNFELVTQKSVEMGIKNIVPIICQHTIKTNLDIDRLNRIAKEAIEQSGQTKMPIISHPVTFVQALEMSEKNDGNLIMQMDGKKMASQDLKKTLGVFIGPEGGWTAEEIEACQRQGFQKISLGSTTLRAETAALVSCAQALYLKN